MARFSPVVSIWIAIVALLTLTGCGDSGDASSSAKPDAGADAAADAPADAPASDACPDGSHSADGGCALDQGCTSASCVHGQCDAAEVCTCEPGWGGASCDACDSAGGYHADGKGGCSNDPCTPSPCLDPDRTCVAAAGSASCACKAGTHDDGGACVVDTTCGANSCAGHGACDDKSGATVCTCDSGWSGTACDQCDAVGGYHDDGQGGCTSNPCIPNACTEAHKTTCVSTAGTPSCECDPGYHGAGGACVVDETCSAGSCAGHGACSVVLGVVQCACDTGYAGTACDQCDATAGYHDDGAGACTSDPCSPNPCTGANQTSCTAQGSAFTCACDAGFHPDGAGGCSDDPCTPDPCLASNQACHVVAGAAECYTPDCDDANPCTTDALVGGACEHTALTDGTTCQTSLCLVGQTCQSGTCSVGSPRVCDDGNPCTADSCDSVQGCIAPPDDSLVPDDGLDCTVDSCASGFAAHAPDDTACDDGKWCTGVELCQPGGQADARGCVTTNVPSPPADPGSCASYGACNESTHDFPLVPKTPGTLCNDGIACTQNDVCNSAGSCAGAPIAGCGTGSCTSSTPLVGDVDIPVAAVSGVLTLGGVALPSTNTNYDGADIYLVAKDTGAAHYIGGYSYQYQSSGNYTLRTGTYGGKVLAGVYDVLYRRYWDGTYNTVSRTTASETHVAGYRYLKRDVVLGSGADKLDLDIPVSTVSGSITLGGAALPSTNTNYDGADIYLVAKDTGAAHYIGGYSYQYQSSGNYTLRTGTYGGKVLAGTYDVLYRRYWDSTYNTVSRTTASETHVAGYRLLKQNVVIAPGAVTLDLDIPVSTVGGTITLGGAALPSTNTNYDGADIYLVAKDTGAAHYIGGYSYQYQSSGNYTLRTGTYGGKVLAGTYDVLYRRYWDSTYNTVSRTTASETHVAGYRLLKQNVVIAPGAVTLDLDIPASTVGGTITLGGAALPSTNTNYDGADIYLVAKDTGAAHYIGGYSYQYQSSGNYTLRTGTYGGKVLAGTYDVLYRRYWDSTYNTVSRTTASETHVAGYRLLKQNVVIAPGAVTLDLDIPVSTVSGSITLGGAALPSTNTNYDGADIYLVAKDTGAAHYIGGYSYQYQSSGNYTLRTGTYGGKVLAGTYDVLYRRYWDSTYNTVSRTTASETHVAGYRLLKQNVVIAPGAVTLDLDIPVSTVGGTITLGGAALPSTNTNYDGADIYLVAKDTGAAHYIGGYSYQYQSSGNYTLRTGTYGGKVLAGNYDVLYRRYWDSTYNTVSRTLLTDTHVAGYRILVPCGAVQ